VQDSAKVRTLKMKTHVSSNEFSLLFCIILITFHVCPYKYCILTSILIDCYVFKILSAVLYGCETWSLILREEHRLKVFKNSVLRITFGPTRDGVTEEWRKLHNKELHNLYSSPNIIRLIKSRKMRWAGHMVHMGEEMYKVLVGKPEGKTPLGRPRRRRKDGIRMDLGEIG
jgi:hypothetical protein